MRKTALTFVLISVITISNAQTPNYITYHQEVIKCEQLIVEGKIGEARKLLDKIFGQFEFAFLREYQLATALCIYEKDDASAFRFLKQGILSGWTLKSIKKDKALKPLRNNPKWKDVAIEYDSLRSIYWSNLNIPLRDEAHDMLKKDQKIALKVLIRIGEKSKTNYALRKFAPHSEKVLIRLQEILRDQGYPGEKLIGNSWWTSVNISHHNSFSTEYTLKDTLYLNLRPALLQSIAKGELHPNEFAIMEDWRNATIEQHETSMYGYLGKIRNNKNLTIVNQHREKLGLRSIELRNKLLDIEKDTGLNLYLPKDWQKGKIKITNK